MAQKKNPQLKLVPSQTLEQIKKRAEKYRQIRIKKGAKIGFLAVMVLFGTYLLLTNHLYQTTFKTNAYIRETSDTNRYEVFRDGIIRYSRDGTAFLNYRNQELWIQPGQFGNPMIDVNGQSFVIADAGGNSIQVFNEDGLKGEFETTLPIERVSVSNQGIVSAILKNETSPLIVTYDATGNILVENQVSVGNAGYPAAIEMSPDGQTLAVSYVSTYGGSLKSRIVFYNFADEGEEKRDHEVSIEEYEDSIIPEVYYMDSNTVVAVGDHSFAVYKGTASPKKTKEIQLSKEIKSSFHTEKYIGFVLLNSEKSGYELCLYNKSGKMIMNRAFSGEYGNVRMFGDEIVLFDGSKCSIFTKTGMPRFKGDLKVDALAVIPAAGINKYYVMSANELRVIYLAG